MTADILKAGTEWLADQLLLHAASNVEYLRGEEPPIPLRATTGRTLFKVEEDGVSKVVWTDKDFLVRASDLAEHGILEPRTGDRVREMVSLASRTWVRLYLVSAPGGEQPYRNADGREVMWRIHTKLHSEEVVV